MAFPCAYHSFVINTITLTFLLLQFRDADMFLAVSEGWHYFFNVHTSLVFSAHAKKQICLELQYDGLKDFCSCRNPKENPSELHFPLLLCSNWLWMVETSPDTTSLGGSWRGHKLLWVEQGGSQTLPLWSSMPSHMGSKSLAFYKRSLYTSLERILFFSSQSVK